MFRLNLFRHAKSAWDDAGLSDIDRPLDPRGVSAAPVMAAAMLELGLAPQVILCSPARRTRQTLDLVLANPGCAAWASTIVYDERLYLADFEQILACVADVPAAIGEVMVIGHNPGLQEAAVELSIEGDPEQLRAIARKVPTAALIVIEFASVDGAAHLAGSHGRLRHFTTPAMRGLIGRRSA